MLFTERLKKYIALGLAVSVMSIGLLSASTSSVSASAPTPTPTTVTSQDGKDITVTADGASKLHITKKDNFHANIDFTNTKGENQNIGVTVTPLSNQKYQIETLEQGVKHVVISDANPLESRKMIGQTNGSSPDVLISFLMTGHADYYTLVSAFGITVANRIMSNWGSLTATLAASGYWAVFYVIMDWQIIGAAVVIGGLA